MNYLHHIKNRHLLPEASPEYLQLAAFLERFRDKRYGEGHALFAAIAAFPVFLTPELLYKLWLNFQTYEDEGGQKQKIHRIAVSDLLLSGLLREVAVDLYEVPPSTRTALLSCLESRFKDKRDILRELAEFMLYYVRSYQLEGESITTTVREAQEWNALAYVDPAAAVRQVREALSGAIRKGSATQQLRINLLLQRLDEQYARTNASTHQLDSFRTLVDYSRGMSDFIRGNHQGALQQFKTLERQATRSSRAGSSLKKVHMPIPKTIYEGLRRTEGASEVAEQGRVFALFAGIDAYPNLPQLKGSTRDANELAYLIRQLVPEERLVTNTLLDAAAHQNLLLGNLREYLQQAEAKDVVLFYFAGHGENSQQGAERNALFFYEYNPEGQHEEAITDEAFRQLVKETAVNNPYITVILDTQAGSDRWLDKNNNKHLVLSACGDEEIPYEGESPGRFSKLLVEILEARKGKITYRQLIRDIRLRLQGQFPELPQLLGMESASLPLFLSNNQSPLPHMQELLREAGYYEGAVDLRAETATEEALRRFTEEWQLDEPEPMKAVQQKILADQRDELRVLVVTGYEPNQINQALGDLFENLSFPIRAERYRPKDPREQAAQKYQPLDTEFSDAVAQRIDKADFVIFLIDDFLIRHEATTTLVDRIYQWRQTDFLPVVPLIVQECDWEKHTVANLPEMRLFRMKGNFLSPEWITTTGMEMIREALEGVGRFMISEEQKRYRELCDRFDPAMSESELLPVRQDLLNAAAKMEDIAFAVSWLKPETSQKYLFGALCALEGHPGGIDHFQKLENLLSQILNRGQLAGLQLVVLFQLTRTFNRILERNELRSNSVISQEQRETLLNLLHRLLQEEQVQADKAEQGAESLCAFVYELIDRITHSLGSNLANYCFEKGLLSEAIAVRKLSEEINMPQPVDAPLQYLITCEQFDGEMSVRDMDRLGSKLQSEAASISDFHFLVDRLRPNLFQGYIFGAAKGIEAQPEARYFGPLLGYLERISQREDLNYENLRLRVLYRLLMGLEGIVENDNTQNPPDIDPERRRRAISVLEAIRDNPRAEKDTKRHKGKGIGGRIEQVIGKLRPAEETMQSQTMEGSAETESTESDESLLRRALFELDFTLQLEVARKEVDIGATVVPIIAPVPLPAGPGLLRDRLCAEFNLPPEWLVQLNLAEAHRSGTGPWLGDWLMQAVFDQLHLRGKKQDIEEFVELLAKEYSHSEIVISLENKGPYPVDLDGEFIRSWLDFADQLVRIVNNQRTKGGIRRLWLLLFPDERLSLDNSNWYISPVTLPSAERVDEKEIDQWCRRLPEGYQEKLYGKFLPSYRPMWPLEVIRELCRELEIEDVYLDYFAEYEPPGNGTQRS